MKCLLFFSDFLLSNEMSGYPENKSTIIFFIHILLLSYEPDKIRQNNMDHPVPFKIAKNPQFGVKCAFLVTPYIPKASITQGARTLNVHCRAWRASPLLKGCWGRMGRWGLSNPV